MVDVWEFMGRLCTSDACRDAFKNGPFQNQYATNGSPTGHAKIPRGDYAALRNLVWSFSPVREPVSVMALGDMLWARTQPKFLPAVDDLAGALKASGVNVDGRSREFYTGLGAMVLDDQLRQFGSGAFEAAGFNIPAGDMADLDRLRTAASVPMNNVCAISWRPDCSLRALEWDEHRHPVANHP